MLTTHPLQFQTGTLSFQTAKKLFDQVELELKDFSGPEWHSEEIMLGDAPLDKHTLYYRKVEDVSDYLLGLLMHQGKLSVVPVWKKNVDDETDVCDEMCSGTAWNDLQVCCPPYFATRQCAETQMAERT